MHWKRVTFLTLLTCAMLEEVQFVSSSPIKVGIILMQSASNEPFDMRRCAPAIDIAMEVAGRDLGIILQPVYRNYSGVCLYEPPVGLLAEMYNTEGIKGVIGPACSQGLHAAGRLAQYLKIPMVTGLGDLVVRKEDVDMFETLTILSYNLKKLSCKFKKTIIFVFDFCLNSLCIFINHIRYFDDLVMLS